MAKTRNNLGDMWTPSNCLIFICSSAFPPHTRPGYHCITAWQTPYYNALSRIVNLATDPANPPDWDEITPVQILACQYFIKNPMFLSDICPDCKQSWSLAGWPRYNIYRGEPHMYVAKACIWDGSWPPEWTPDVTELTYAY